MDLRNALKGLLNVIFPPLCLGCKKHTKETFLCRRCQEKIEINNAFYCPRCNRRLPAGREGFLKSKNTCHPEMKFILAAATSYQNEVIRELIHMLKYKRIKTALEPLTEIMGSYLEKVISNLLLVISNSVIIPIPLHAKKERRRGFNQATLIADILHQYLEAKFPVERANLVKIKSTSSQTDLKDYEERTRNVERCFALNYPEKIKGKNILLVDDVFTSGATMKEAVRVLKLAGAKKIIGFVIAKA
ncbi:MAG: ComF family protein [Patescibacteria group bacterium]|nr:ComF family protein [Patescibacteria group bacterium]